MASRFWLRIIVGSRIVPSVVLIDNDRTMIRNNGTISTINIQRERGCARSWGWPMSEPSRYWLLHQVGGVQRATRYLLLIDGDRTTINGSGEISHIRTHRERHTIDGKTFTATSQDITDEQGDALVAQAMHASTFGAKVWVERVRKITGLNYAE